MSTQRLLSILAVLPALLIVACSESSEDKTADTEEHNVGHDTTATAPLLPDSVWIARGMPDPGHPWSSDDMQKAYEVLQKASADGGELPRYDSTGRNRMFAHIVSRENLAFFRDDSIAVDQRVNRGITTVSAFTQIYFLYTRLAMNGGPYLGEMTEMIATLLKAEAEFAVLMTSFIETVPRDRRETEEFKGGMKQMREGIAQSISGTITMLRDKSTFSAQQLERIALALKETSSDMLPFLDEELRSRLRAEAEQTIAETENGRVKDVLREIFQTGREAQ